MSNRAVVLLLVAVGFLLAASRVSSQSPFYVPKEGFVPNEKTAILIAEAVLSPIYGEEQITKERPFAATLKDGIWTVSGHVFTPNGGAAIAEIAKSDGRILRVTHGK